MADTQALFNELKTLSPSDAKTLGEMLKAKFPQKEAKAETQAPAEDASDSASEE
jgi:hypothetical protein